MPSSAHFTLNKKVTDTEWIPGIFEMCFYRNQEDRVMRLGPGKQSLVLEIALGASLKAGTLRRSARLSACPSTEKL